MNPLSKPIWSLIPILDVAQFSSRLLILVAICTSMLAGYLTLLLSKRKFFIYLIVVFTISYTILNWGHRHLISGVTDKTLISNLPKSTKNYEGVAFESTRWVDKNNPWEKEMPKDHLEILSGSAQTIKLKRTPVYHTYIVSSLSKIELKENTLYFPGWKVLANQKELRIFYTNKKYPGIITFSLPKGTYFVEIQYNDLPIHHNAKIFTLVLLALIILYTLVHFFKKLKILNQ